MKVAVVLLFPVGDAEESITSQADRQRVNAYVALSHKLLAVQPESVRLDLARDDVAVNVDDQLISTWQNNLIAARFVAEAENWLLSADAKKGNVSENAVGGVGFYDPATRFGQIIYAERG